MKRIHTGISSILHCVMRQITGREERIIWKTVEERNFLHDLEN
jgi:hypothetical protein